jgi:predicted ATP-dependent endonuclease of OLD family
MVEKLIVKKFAGIENIELEVKKINILIGPQASGKSICAKLLFYFKNFVWQILSTVEQDQTKRDLDKSYSRFFEECFPKKSWGKDVFFIRYEISNLFIEITKPYGRDKLSLTYSDTYKKELEWLRREFKKVKSSDELTINKTNHKILIPNFKDYLSLRYAWMDRLEKKFSREVSFQQIFIPAGRALFAFLQRNIFTFMLSKNEIDPFFKHFGSIYENMKNIWISQIRNRTNKIDREIDNLIKTVLCGQYIHDKGEDFLESEDGRRIGIANSSSGQQETLPLAIILTTLPFITSDRIGKTVYIEEPEAHLFPSAQRNIVELIATIFNYHEESDFQLFITTHSPYILTAINNLLQAGLIYRNSEQEIIEKLEKIVPRYKALITEDLAAYEVANGKCKNIICSETGLIDAHAIDAVSDELAIEFDNLLNLT